MKNAYVAAIGVSPLKQLEKDAMMYVVEGECEISPKYNTVDGPFVNFL